MEKNVCIVNFNTTALTTAAIKSVWKTTPDCAVTVFDNSDKEPFPEMDGVRIIDNTKGDVIDFERFLSGFPNKVKTYNSWGSAKHCYTVQKLFDYFPEGFVLMDSDVLVKKDISDLFDCTCLFVGEVCHNPKKRNSKIPRLLPFLCWINVSMCKEKQIDYFDPGRSWRLNGQQFYDTGASFLEDCNRHSLPTRRINLEDYIIHFGAGSWQTDKSPETFLNKYRYLYE